MQARHHQHIGRTGQAGERIGRFQQLIVERHVGLHLAVIFEIDLFCVQQPDRLADAIDAIDLAAAEVGERHEGDARVMTHGAGIADHLLGDSGKLLGRGRLVDRGVGQEHRAVARHHDRIAHRHLAGLLVDHALDVAVAFGEAARDAGHHAVGVAHRHHAGAEHVAALVDHALHVAAQVAVALQALVDHVGVGRVARA